MKLSKQNSKIIAKTAKTIGEYEVTDIGLTEKGIQVKKSINSKKFSIETIPHKEILKKLKRNINTLRNTRDNYKAIYEKQYNPEQYCNRIRRAAWEVFIAQPKMYAMNSPFISQKSPILKLFRQLPNSHIGRIEHIELDFSNENLLQNKIEVRYIDTQQSKKDIEVLRIRKLYLSISGSVNKPMLTKLFRKINDKVIYLDQKEEPYTMEKTQTFYGANKPTDW